MILVTGGLGFVGTNLSLFLVKKGYDVRVIDNRLNNAVNFIDGADTVWAHIRANVNGLWDKVDMVVHLAAIPGVEQCAKNPELAWDTNVNCTKELLYQAGKHNVKRFVFASSVGAVLGPQEQPARESQTPNPQTVYGNSKKMAESLVLGSELSSCVLRFTNVYGEHSQKKGNVIPKLLRHNPAETFIIYGDGEQVRDFVYAGDVSEAILRALEGEANGIYHIGSGRGVKVLDLIAEVERIRGCEIPVEFAPAREGDIKENIASVERANNILKWEATTPLSKGLELTYRALGTYVSPSSVASA